MTIRDRADRALALAKAESGSLLITSPHDVRWITGFTGSHAWLVASRDEMCLLTDGRYLDQARSQTNDAIEVRLCRTSRDMIDAVVSSTHGDLHVDETVLDVATWRSLCRSLDRFPSPASTDLADLRRQKSSEEIRSISRAADIASEALAHCLAMIEPGTTEKRLRDALESRMRELGADGPSYDTIVASGPSNSARPHHQPTDRKFEKGDALVIDVGALLDGYHSDMTRTFFVGGEPKPELLSWYACLLEAQEAAIAVVEPGRRVGDVDEVARTILRRHGVDQWFTHGLGHGVGLLIHENPFLRAASDVVLRAGDVVTIEPGLYREGLGGIRIEDLLLVGESSTVNLTKAPKDPICPR